MNRLSKRYFSSALLLTLFCLAGCQNPFQKPAPAQPAIPAQLPPQIPVEPIAPIPVEPAAVASDAPGAEPSPAPSPDSSPSPAPEPSPTAVPEPSPSPIPPVRTIIKTALNNEGGCTLFSTGELYCWGNESLLIYENSYGTFYSGQSYGNLGIGSTAFMTSPTTTRNKVELPFATYVNGPRTFPTKVLSQVQSPNGGKIVDIAMGSSFTCAIAVSPNATRELYCWGYGQFGELGQSGFQAGVESTYHSYSPLKVTGVPGIPISITAGNSYACAINDEKQAYCWGNNHYSQLGVASQAIDVSSPVPKKVSLTLPVLQISANQSLTCAVVDNNSINEVYCWGSNYNGMAGVGSTSLPLILIPTKVLGSEGAVQVSAGGTHACMRMNSGKVKCWGQGSEGQLGYDGILPHPTDPKRIPTALPVNQSSPVEVLTINDATDLSTGTNHTCVVRAASEVMCFGYLGFGALGHGCGSGTSTVEYSIDPFLKHMDPLLQPAGSTLAIGIPVEHGAKNVYEPVNYVSDLEKGILQYTVTNANGTQTKTACNSISRLKKSVAVIAKDSGTCVLRQSGQSPGETVSIACFGLNTFGQIGIGNILTKTAIPVELIF